jgi:hypothetical protein
VCAPSAASYDDIAPPVTVDIAEPHEILAERLVRPARESAEVGKSPPRERSA